MFSAEFHSWFQARSVSVPVIASRKADVGSSRPAWANLDPRDGLF